MPDRILDGLDDMLTSKVRLAIMAVLSVGEWAAFSYLKKRTGASDGNLSVHLRKLEEEKYVEMIKSFVDRTPQTRYRLTQKGRKALSRHVDFLASIIENSSDSRFVRS